MSPTELLAEIRQKQPTAFTDIPDTTAVNFLRAALDAIHASIESCSEGKVMVKGLGKFIVKSKAAPEGGPTKRKVRFSSGSSEGKGKGKGKRKAKPESEE